jgi:alkanesulfonate monooxygenase SsuD/methylene tetrahydromethanopterin reductase-like flavin-dependent oxidoreductase (luciferase family)
MKFGLAVSGRGDPKLLEQMAIKADDLGYDSMLITDHFMVPDANNPIDAWSFLPYLVAKTQKIRLGTIVTPIPFRPPTILAKMISTVDNLSNGRVILGAGFGWFKPEFDGFSEWLETKDRIMFTEEAVQLMQRLWTQDGPVDYAGKFVHSKGAVIEPKPVQKPYPPIWFGGHQSQSLRMAGKYGNGWIPVGPRWIDGSYAKPEEYAEKKAAIVRGLKKRNISEKDFVFSVLISMTELPQLRSDIDKYVDAGMNYFIVGEKARSNESLSNIDAVAKEIGSSL